MDPSARNTYILAAVIVVLVITVFVCRFISYRRRKRSNNSDNHRSREVTSSLTDPLIDPENPSTPENRSTPVEDDEEEGEYDGYGWSELPYNVKKAAKLLGYTKSKWDRDLEPETFDYDWDELEPAQQEAAAVFGYNQEKWDTEE